MTIAITGASGHLGRLAIETLLKTEPASNIVALVRQPENLTALSTLGVDVRHFDYNSAESQVPALQGVDKLLLISGNNIGQRVAQHQAVITAAQLAQVPYIAYTSILDADQSTLGLAQEHRETEKLIRDSGLKYTLLRNGWYNENYTGTIQRAVALGTLFSAAKNGKMSSAARQDYAEAAAQVLTTSGHDNKTYELAGSSYFTYADLANYIGMQHDHTIHYQNLSANEYLKSLLENGIDEGLAHFIVDTDSHIAQDVLYSESKDLQQLIGRESTSIQHTIQHVLNYLNKY